MAEQHAAPVAVILKRGMLAVLSGMMLAACYQTENGLVWGLPDYEKRDIRVTQSDLDILLKVDALLPEEAAWSREGGRSCQNRAKLNLLCALEQATVTVTGAYHHRQPALQMVRFVIDDHYRDRWKVHRLEDFNVHPDTSFRDVKNVLAQATRMVKTRLGR